MRAKDGFYNGASYGLIDSNTGAMAGLDIPMPQTAKKLPYPTTAGYFFETIKDEALDTFDKIIKITKKGYLKLTVKTNIFTNGGIIDFQLYRMHLDTSYVATRRRCLKDGYTEINFNIDVDVGDRIYIYIQCSLGDAFLKYTPVDGYLTDQSAYIINMELIEPFDDIGSLVWSVDPNLENFGNCIRLDVVRPLLIDDYPLLYSKLSSSQYIDTDDGVNFSLVDFTKHPYLRSGSSLNLLKQNLPDPLISSNFSGSTDSVGDGTAKFGGNYWLSNDVNETSTSTDIAKLDGTERDLAKFRYCFKNSDDDVKGRWGGNWGGGPHLSTTNITLKTEPHNHPIDYTIVSQTTNEFYSSDKDFRPNSSQMFLYMICDNQL